MLDLNCDMGEVEETWFSGRDQKLMQFIDSVNISCGFHAGNENLIRQTIAKASELNLNIGIHPGFNDPENFGRKEHPLSSKTLEDLLKKQFDQFLEWATLENAQIHHIKAHGALYNMLAKDYQLSTVYIKVVKDYDPDWIVFGLPESETAKATMNHGVPFWPEAFADRTYTSEGFLTPRSDKNAHIKEPEKAFNQVKSILESGQVLSTSGRLIPLRAKTFCIHGDSPYAFQIAQKLIELK